MASIKLTRKQRNIVLLLIAADYPNAVIFHRLSKINADGETFKPGDESFPEIGITALSYYRSKFSEDIERVRAKRRDDALSSGLAIKAERVRRLAEHADELEIMKWNPDANGRLWNERAWRQTLEDIAIEMGDRRASKEEGTDDGVVKIYIGIDEAKV